VARCDRSRSSYRALKDHLSWPERRVLEELVEERKLPCEVASRLVLEQHWQGESVYSYIREVLWRSLLAMTGAEARPAIDWVEEQMTTN